MTGVLIRERRGKKKKKGEGDFTHKEEGHVKKDGGKDWSLLL